MHGRKVGGWRVVKGDILGRWMVYNSNGSGRREGMDGRKVMGVDGLRMGDD